MVGVSVETAAGQLHPCYNAPYLTGGLVFSRARAPFSHGQLGGHQEPRHQNPLASWSLGKWKETVAPASLRQLSFIEIKGKRGQSPRAVGTSRRWWTNLLFVIQMATCILEFSCLMVFWIPVFVLFLTPILWIYWRSQKGKWLSLCLLHYVPQWITGLSLRIHCSTSHWSCFVSPFLWRYIFHSVIHSFCNTFFY